MSKIFELLQKNGAIEMEESSVPPPPELPPQVRAEADSILLPARPMSLRVSALAPIFPFSEGLHYAAAEQYRVIRTKILHNEKRPQLVLVSSACSGDGKTITSINVAASLTLKADASVLLIDADLRKPAIAELLGMPHSPGLADVLSGRARLEEAVVRAQEFPNLFILPAGDAAQNAAELLDSEQWRQLAAEIRKRFQNVIIDAPPAAAVADCDLLQKTCDGVIVVVRPDHTNRAACMKVLYSIPKEKFLGVVLNHVREWLFWKAPAYYHYYGRRQPTAG